MAGERVLYFDTERCVGCHACETACKIENGISPGPKWIEVVQQVVPREDDGWTIKFMPLNCRHCTNAGCVTACPTGAVAKRPDGVVLVNRALCIGCGECLQECPFGAPQFGPGGLMEKCTLCSHRPAGSPTACEQLCPVGAIRSGTPHEVSLHKRSRYLITAIALPASQER
ncbi:MAG: 4Fe-4S dicluster domain-containing protein [Thermodesulfovibrionales bacterium]